MYANRGNDSSNVRRRLRFESFVRQNNVFGFDHLHPTGYPTMSAHHRGIALSLQSLSGLLAPISEDDGEMSVRLSLSLFHVTSKSFFGSTWMSNAISIIRRNKNDSLTVTLDEIVYIVTRITDPNCVCIAEIIVSTLDKRGIASSQYGCGWTILSIFNESSLHEYDDLKSIQISKSPIFSGSPRDLMTADDESNIIPKFSVLNGTTLQYVLFNHKRLLRIQRLVSENSLIGKYDVIPGLLPREILPPGQTRVKEVPCLGFQFSPAEVTPLALPGKVSIELPITLQVKGIKLIIDGRIQVENRILSSINLSMQSRESLLNRSEIAPPRSLLHQSIFASQSSQMSTSVYRRILRLGNET